MGRRISQTIDFELSIEEHRTVVRTGVDDTLDEMKRTYDGIESVLSEVAKHIACEMPDDIKMYLNVVFFPQIGFLIAVPLDPDTGLAVYEGGIEDEWERIFVTE
jgi:DNA mismatch repair protein MSH5